MSERVAIGIDLGGTNIKGGVVTANGESLDKQHRPTYAGQGFETVVDRIVEFVHHLRKENDVTDERLIGVGIGIPGVTTRDGVVVLAPNLGWHKVPFRDVLRDRLGVRVEVDNDANAAALAEARIGVGRGCSELVLVTLGTGIGGGIVFHGRIHHGASNSSGEIGHMTILPDGPICACGKPGCLEALASGPAMVRRMKALRGAAPDDDTITPQSICEDAEAGDPQALQVVNEAGRYIGIAMASIINVYSPDVIAVGGGISAAGNVILDPILESTRAYTLKGLFEHTRMELASLGNDAGYLGAAQLVLVPPEDI